MSSILPTWFHACRRVLRVFLGKLRVRGEENLDGPTVFITRHLNNYGPLAVYAFMPVEFRLWSYHVFMDKNAYYQHCSKFTFRKRLGLPSWAANALAWLLRRPNTWLYRRLNMIPVYRSSREIMKTMEMSVQSLMQGQNVLIMADVDYVDKGENLGEMYAGFVYLGKLYHKRTGARLRFTPVSINRAQGYLRIGKPVVFNPETSYPEEKQRVSAELRAELHDNNG